MAGDGGGGGAAIPIALGGAAANLMVAGPVAPAVPAARPRAATLHGGPAGRHRWRGGAGPAVAPAGPVGRRPCHGIGHFVTTDFSDSFTSTIVSSPTVSGGDGGAAATAARRHRRRGIGAGRGGGAAGAATGGKAATAAQAAGSRATPPPPPGPRSARPTPTAATPARHLHRQSHRHVGGVGRLQRAGLGHQHRRHGRRLVPRHQQPDGRLRRLR